MRFKEFISESNEMAAYYLKKYPQHTDFINKFLGNRKNNRYKYLGWLTDSLAKERLNPNKEFPISAAEVGKHVDQYDEVKHSKGYEKHRTIDKLGDHRSFIETLKALQKYNKKLD